MNAAEWIGTASAVTVGVLLAWVVKEVIETSVNAMHRKRFGDRQ